MLADAIGGRVNRRQAGFQWSINAVFHQLVFRVIKLKATGATAGLAVAAHHSTGSELVFLGSIEMIKTQTGGAGMVLNFNQQAAAFAEQHAGATYLALNNRRAHGLHTANGGNPAAIFVAERQMEEQIRQITDLQFLQLVGQFRANPFQFCQLAQTCHRPALVPGIQSTLTSSIQ